MKTAALFIGVGVLLIFGSVMLVTNVVADWRAAWGDCGPRVGGSHGR